ncbi:MAG: GNAT family N-acetyltransferase [Acidimicrobiia bacterium]
MPEARLGVALLLPPAQTAEVDGLRRCWASVTDAPFGPPAVVGRGGLALELTVSELVDPEALALLPERHVAGGEEGRPFAVVARREGVVVGLAAGATARPTATLTSLVVCPDHRNQGTGSHILAAAASHAARQGCSNLVAGPELVDEVGPFLRLRGWAWRETPAGLGRHL